VFPSASPTSLSLIHLPSIAAANEAAEKTSIVITSFFIGINLLFWKRKQEIRKFTTRLRQGRSLRFLVVLSSFRRLRPENWPTRGYFADSHLTLTGCEFPHCMLSVTPEEMSAQAFSCAVRRACISVAAAAVRHCVRP